MRAFLTFITQHISDTYPISGEFPSIEEAVVAALQHETDRGEALDLQLRFATPKYQLFERGPTRRLPKGLVVVALEEL